VACLNRRERRRFAEIVRELVCEAGSYDHVADEGRGAAWLPFDPPQQLAYRFLAHETRLTIGQIETALRPHQAAVSAIVVAEDAAHETRLKYARSAYAKHVRREARGGAEAIAQRWHARAETRRKATI
jgi:hypothetical protein